ncbi:hypothetical protein HYT26_00940 [Candidatus Pacearchaeota archaeon]|nr:hypothetical protein [Candidatus Pacearchaeota archaeon]
MKTIREKCEEELIARGISFDEAKLIMESLIIDIANASMKNRWNDDAEGYPPVIFEALWLSIEKHTLEYIKKNCPDAWFRGLFESNG